MECGDLNESAPPPKTLRFESLLSSWWNYLERVIGVALLEVVFTGVGFEISKAQARPCLALSAS